MLTRHTDLNAVQAGVGTPRGSGTPSQASRKERERNSFFQSLRKKPADAAPTANGTAASTRSASLASETSSLGSYLAQEVSLGSNGHSHAPERAPDLDAKVRSA